MIKRTGLIIGLLLCQTVYSIDTEVPDKRFQSCILEHIQQHKWTEPSQAKTLKCNGYSIKSVQGLQQFTHLKKLYLFNNLITEIDLSEHPNLEIVNLARNRLSRLNLSNLEQLTELFIFGNQLESLRLSNLPKLKKIKANNNKITEFKYHELPYLKMIYLFDNEMETIDINHLPRMTYMDVRHNPMPDELYERMDRMAEVTFLHDGNADDW